MNKANKIYIDKKDSKSHLDMYKRENDLNKTLRFIRFNNAPYITIGGIKHPITYTNEL